MVLTDKLKVLCFTTSYKRPYFLRNAILSVLNQTYKDIDYSIGICVDDTKEQQSYEYLLSDITDNRLHLFFHPNSNQHDNYLYPIKNTIYQNYDLFIKIDDDDIYKNNYIEYMISNYHKYQTDVLSANITYQINNNLLHKGFFDNVGGHWHEDLKSNTKFGMPFTYVFNQKALNILLNTTHSELQNIHPFEDAGWRKKWRDKNIRSKVLDSIDNAIYNIHGNNISSSHMLVRRDGEHQYIENDFFIIAYFEHFCWNSYCFVDKKNKRITNIQNNHYGDIINVNSNHIIIKWDKYAKETFIRNNNIFKYQ